MEDWIEMRSLENPITFLAGNYMFKGRDKETRATRSGVFNAYTRFFI